MRILITGAAGFIGFHLSKLLIEHDYIVIGIDNLNSYYDIKLKKSRLEILSKLKIKFFNIDISNQKDLENCISENLPDIIVNLAAQAGVRFSISYPDTYITSNIIGFYNILEACKKFQIKHLIYASSSSVYGSGEKSSFSEDHKADQPLSLYAASKKSNELMAYAYANINNLPCTALRFFTVYGPWGRPDMAYFKFVKSIMSDKPIDIYGHGNMSRDFTYIDDVTNTMINLLNIIPKKSDKNNYVPHETYNIGNNKPEKLEYFISVIEKELGKKAFRNYLPMQKGDVIDTFANIDKIKSKVSYTPKIKIEEGIRKFIKWYLEYYKN